MKKQWILIIVLAALLVTADIIASRSFPDINETPTTGSSQTTESGSTDESTENTQNSFPTVSYEEYQNMTGEDRQTYYEKFSSDDAFNAWLKEAREEYETHRATIPTIDGDNPIDIGGLIGSMAGEDDV